MHLARLITLVTLIISLSSFSQQESLHFHFWNIQPYYLPAMTGIENKQEAVILARDHWIGLNGHPRILNVQYSQRLNKINSGIGFIYQAQKVGFSHSHKAKLSYAYHLELGEKQLLSFGTNIGVNFYKIKAEWIPPTPTPDPTFPSEFLQTNFSSDFGVNYKHSNWQIGLGATQFTHQRKMDNFTYTRHYFLQSSYIFRVGKQMKLTPRLLLQTDFLKIAATVNAQLKVNQWLQVGLVARSSSFLGVNVGCYFLKNFYLGYCGEVSSSPLMTLKKNYSHEAVMSFSIPDKK